MAAPLMTELGSTGLRRVGGYVQEEFLRELSGIRGAQTYREMRDNHPVIGGFLFAIDMLMRGAEWRFEPASSSTEDTQAAEFADQCKDDMSSTWEDFISEVLSMLAFGWSYHELCYKRRQGPSRNPLANSKFTDGRIGWRKIPTRAQESLYQWQFDDSGGVQAMEQIPPPDYQRRIIPIEKALLFRTSTAKGNPEGRSCLRSAYVSWYFQTNIQRIEGIGIERDLAGLPVVSVPPELLGDDAGLTADQRTMRNAFFTMVKNIRRDEQEGVVMPLDYDESGNKLYELALLSTGGARQFDTNAISMRYDQRIAGTVLADFILLGHEAVGSKALSVDKTNMFRAAVNAWLDSIAATINRHALPRLFALNGIRVEAYPRLMHSDLQVPNLTELGDFIKSATGAGWALFPDENLEGHLRTQAGWPEQAEDAHPLAIAGPGAVAQDQGVPSDADIAALDAQQQQDQAAAA